ncbi:HEAT repeat-containing protein [Toxoplasma gondii ARI]|uniref:HEAT repeat-containing protein n=1 Tax=Toxoplasma gondii ARI TaxID=1074872 RepID=A0A139Y0M1_TOXGO|nr:HEAT repeat-containing protein [Toxoplasma gondii ARI]
MEDVEEIWKQMNLSSPAPGSVQLTWRKQARERKQKTSFENIDLAQFSVWKREPLRSVHCSSLGVGTPPGKSPQDDAHLSSVQSPEEDLLEFPWKTGDREHLQSFLRRQANILADDRSVLSRLLALQKLKACFLHQECPPYAYDLLLTTAAGPLMDMLSHWSETCRELAAEISSSMAKHVSAVDGLLRVAIPIAVMRFGSQDVEGVAHLPEVMRPPPGQKPTQLIPVESSEEVRGAMLKFVSALVERCSDDAIWENMDGIVSILRACAMDQCAAIQVAACAHICNFCDHHHDGLFHFTEALARSLFSCLVHPHSKVRLHGLKAISAVMKCGQYKYNASVVQMLVGWQDPNVVPIKAFYEPWSTHNYLARLVVDRAPAVRMYFYETIVQWIHRLPDKGDYESWLFPYLLTGIFDENTSIQKLVYWLIEKCGELYEKEKEKDIRAVRQLNYQQPWTYEGRGSFPFPLGGCLNPKQTGCTSLPESAAALDAEFVREYETQTISLTEGGSFSGLQELLGELDDVLAKPVTRPRLGSRCWVKVHFRRYAKGLFKEVTDFKEVKSESSARLLVASLAYVEESITEWLEELVHFCSNLYARKAVLPNGLLPLYDEALKMVGAYVDPVSYWKLFEDVFDVTCPLELKQRAAVLVVFTKLLDGSVTVLKSVGDKTLGAGRLQPILSDVCQKLSRSDLLAEQCIRDSGSPIKAVCCAKILETLLLQIDWLVESCGKDERTQLFAATLAVSGPLLQKQDQQEQSGQEDSHSVESTLTIFRILKTLVVSQAETRVNDFVDGIGSLDDVPEEPLLDMLNSLVSLPPSSCNTASLSCLLAIVPPALTLHESIFTALLGRLVSFRHRTHHQHIRRHALEAAIQWILRLLNSQDEGAADTSDEDCLYDGVRQIASHIVLPIFCSSDGFCGTKRELDCLLPLVTSSGEQTSSCEARKAYFLMTSGIPEALAELVANETVHRSAYLSALKALRVSSIAKYGKVANDDWLNEVPVTTRRQTRLQAIQTSSQLKQKAVTLLYGAVVQILLGATSPTSAVETTQVLDCLTRVFTKIRRALVPVKELTRLSEINDSVKTENQDTSLRDNQSTAANHEGAEVDSTAKAAKCLPLQPLDGGVAFYAVNLIGLILQSVQVISSQNRIEDFRPELEDGDARSQTECERNRLMSMPRMWDGHDSLQPEKLVPKHSSSFYSRNGPFIRKLDKCRRQCLVHCIPQADFHELIGHAVKFYVELGSKIHCEGFNGLPSAPDPVLVDEFLPATSEETLGKVIVALESVTEENKRTNAAAALLHLLVNLASTFPDSIQMWHERWSSRGHVMRAEVVTAFQKLASTVR